MNLWNRWRTPTAWVVALVILSPAIPRIADGLRAIAAPVGGALREPPAYGYRDGPFLPGSEWRVHDSDRPLPRRVTPGDRFSEGARPPADARVLFDGTGFSEWEGGPWRTVDGAMEVNDSGDLRTREHFGDCQLHLEWRAPVPAEGMGQHRGNSGVFFLGRYEVQVLDSYQNPTYADGSAAALYGQHPPAVDACRAPGRWQTYDIVFEAPRFDGDRLVRPARATVFHNGVLVHLAREFVGATCHRTLARYAPHPEVGPLVLQDHRDRQGVRFRNIWIRHL